MLMLFCSCTKEIEYTGGYEGEKLVLFSCANPDTILTAAVYKSVFIYSRDQENCEQGLSGAKVTAVVNGKDTYTFREVKTVYDKESEDYWMHGGKDYDVEYVSDYIPKTGDHIVVKASYKGMKDVQGETTVPDRPSIKLNKVDTEYMANYGLYTVNMSVTINDPADRNNYYRMNVIGKRTSNVMGYYDECYNLFSKDILFYDTSIGGLLDSIDGESVMIPDYFDDGSFNGRSRTFEFWFHQYLMTDEQQNPHPGKCRICVDNASESLYMYSRSIDAYNGNDGIEGLFGELVIIYSNVENGMGCVGAVAGTEIDLSEFLKNY